MESSGSSSIGSYSDGVYDKKEGQSQHAATNKPLPTLKPPILPGVMLACLILLFITCFVGILLSGLHFGHRVTSGDCLGQSWVMFSVRYTTSHHSPLTTHHSSQGLSKTQSQIDDRPGTRHMSISYACAMLSTSR